MIYKCRKLTQQFIALLILAVTVSCCPFGFRQGNQYFPVDAVSDSAASIYASFAPLETIRTGRTEERQEIIADIGSAEPNRQKISKNTLLLHCITISLCFASICIAILYAVTKAASANLYIIKFIQLSDGMK